MIRSTRSIVAGIAAVTLLLPAGPAVADDPLHAASGPVATPTDVLPSPSASEPSGTETPRLPPTS